ncbi:MAG: ABC transporter permease [Planctomycetota bacterium]
MYRFLDYLLAGIMGVLRHKMRSFLAVLGIVLAISALLSMLAVGEGARRQLLNDMEHLGLRNIIVTSQKPQPKPSPKSSDNSDAWRIVSYGITRKDAARCKALLPGVQRVVTVHEVTRPVVIRGHKVNARVLGVNQDYFKLHSLAVQRGRLLCALDELPQSQSCMMAAPLPQDINQGRDPYGLEVDIGGTVFKVVGTVTPESNLLDTGASGKDSKSGDSATNAVVIYIPFDLAFSRFGSASMKQEAGSYEYYKLEINQMILECEDPIACKRPIESIMRKDHKEVDYEVTVPVELLAQRQHTQEVFNLVLLLVAGITLLVGGVGIVNIMLVSVTERTKEIGIRRALGARRSDIMIQFLIETLALTMSGGIIGVLMGFGGIYAVEVYTGWPVTVTVPAVIGSFMLSIISGVIFGMYPARKAASVTPMIALRYE